MTEVRAARRAVAAVFFVNGALFGSLAARVPAVRDHADVSNGELGFALACLALGSIVAMPVAGAIAARHGSRRVTRVFLALFCAAVVLPPLATSLPLLALAFLVTGVAMGSLDVTMNAHGVAVERRIGRPILSGFHAAFSFGGLTGAASAALASHAGLDVRAQLALAAAAGLAVGVVWSRRFLPAGEDAGEPAAPLFVRPPRRLWALGAIGFACLLAEGAAADWSAIYVRDDLGAAAATGALAYTVFSLTMAVGRLAGDRIVASVGPVRSLRVGGVVAAVGFGAALVADGVLPAFLGFAALGAGLSVVVPILFRASSQAPGVPAGIGLAAVSSMSYLGFVAGPPTIGGLSEWIGLPAALGLLAAVGVVIVALARTVEPVGRDECPPITRAAAA